MEGLGCGGVGYEGGGLWREWFEEGLAYGEGVGAGLWKGWSVERVVCKGVGYRE